MHQVVKEMEAMQELSMVNEELQGKIQAMEEMNKQLKEKVEEFVEVETLHKGNHELQEARKELIEVLIFYWLNMHIPDCMSYRMSLTLLLSF